MEKVELKECCCWCGNKYMEVGTMPFFFDKSKGTFVCSNCVSVFSQVVFDGIKQWAKEPFNPNNGTIDGFLQVYEANWAWKAWTEYLMGEQSGT